MATNINYTVIVESSLNPDPPGRFASGTPLYILQRLSGQSNWSVVNDGTGSHVEYAGTFYVGGAPAGFGARFDTRFPNRGVYRVAVGPALGPPWVDPYNICVISAQTVTIQDPPTVNIIAAPSGQVGVGTDQQFTAAGTIDALAVNSQLQFVWNFGDGSGDITTASTSITHKFNSPGQKTVTVRSFDGTYPSSQVSMVVDVVGPTPPTLALETIACANGWWTIDVNWGPTNTAIVDNYQVEISQNYGPFVLIYDGPALNVQHQAYKNTNQRVRVRACKNGGCSSDTQQSLQLPNHCNVQ